MAETVDWKQTGIKINVIRKQLGYSIKQMAASLFISESTIKNYLYSETPISVETLLHIANLFCMEKAEDLLVFSK